MLTNKNSERICSKMRPITIKIDALGYADASVLLEIGKTKVLTSISLQNKVPKFLRGSGTGWLTAEYAMLPCATQKRTVRDSSQFQKNPRSVEISRLIGRSLRTVTDLSAFGERSILIDCDVLQADGGTRVACITAASLALRLAEKRWLDAKLISKNIVKDFVAAVSVGFVDGQICLDLDFKQDRDAKVDFNFVLTKGGKIIEIQGTCEKSPVDWEIFEELKNLAINGVGDIFKAIEEQTKNMQEFVNQKTDKPKQMAKNSTAFSLCSRLAK